MVDNPLILILDNIIDPRNLGACIRSAAVIGVDALIINKHHCTPINAIAHKVSVGGAEVIKIFHVTNLINCLKFFKESFRLHSFTLQFDGPRTRNPHIVLKKVPNPIDI